MLLSASLTSSGKDAPESSSRKVFLSVREMDHALPHVKRRAFSTSLEELSQADKTESCALVKKLNHITRNAVAIYELKKAFLCDHALQIETTTPVKGT